MDTFLFVAFFLLGIERFLYAYVYNFPSHFKSACRRGTFGKALQKEPLYWKAFMQLGIYVKVFQYSVIFYDLVVRNSISVDVSSLRFWAGLVLVGIGQFFNYAVYQALGGIGVYYGWELGYKVDRVTGFPYNLGIPDPQYWGVVLCIWGIYLVAGSSSFVTPILETFWYNMSMKILEHPNGMKILKASGLASANK